MKYGKILFLAGWMALFCACDDEDKSIDPTLLPEITATGENVLGCVIDSWIYNSARWGVPTVHSYTIETEETAESCIKVEAYLGQSTHLSFVLVNPIEGKECDCRNILLDNEELRSGKASIIRMDGHVVSGTFENDRIQYGRFDLSYHRSDEEEKPY